jgi:hypothetical protein
MGYLATTRRPDLAHAPKMTPGPLASQVGTCGERHPAQPSAFRSRRRRWSLTRTRRHAPPRGMTGQGHWVEPAPHARARLEPVLPVAVSCRHTSRRITLHHARSILPPAWTRHHAPRLVLSHVNSVELHPQVRSQARRLIPLRVPPESSRHPRRTPCHRQKLSWSALAWNRLHAPPPAHPHDIPMKPSQARQALLLSLTGAPWSVLPHRWRRHSLRA